jgi:hypothetical protein
VEQRVGVSVSVSAVVLLLLAVVSYLVWIACLDCEDRGGWKEVVGTAIMLARLGLFVPIVLMTVLLAISATRASPGMPAATRTRCFPDSLQSAKPRTPIPRGAAASSAIFRLSAVSSRHSR